MHSESTNGDRPRTEPGHMELHGPTVTRRNQPRESTEPGTILAPYIPGSAAAGAPSVEAAEPVGEAVHATMEEGGAATDATQPALDERGPAAEATEPTIETAEPSMETTEQQVQAGSPADTRPADPGAAEPEDHWVEELRHAAREPVFGAPPRESEGFEDVEHPDGPAVLGASGITPPAADQLITHDAVEEVAARLERLAGRLRDLGLDAVAGTVRKGDRFDALLAGLVAGFLAAAPETPDEDR